MKVVVNEIEVDVDDRHIKSPLMWALRFVFGPDDSEQRSPPGEPFRASRGSIGVDESSL
jgi:hypothetical protein